MRKFRKCGYILLLFVVQGCVTYPEQRAGDTSQYTYTALPAPVSAKGSVIWDLATDQVTNVGTVAVTNDLENLYVQYMLQRPSSTFGMLRTWAGTDIDRMPIHADGTPIPEQFCSAIGGACFSASELASYTFRIPLAELGIADNTQVLGTQVYVVPYAEIDIDVHGTGVVERKTAFGGCKPSTGGCSWVYGQYTNVADSRYPVETASRWPNGPLYSQ